MDRKKERFFEEKNMLKRNKHGAGAKFYGCPFFRKKKTREIDAKTAPESHVFWSEILSGTDLGGLISFFCVFFGDVEKSMIFDIAPGRSKIDVVDPGFAVLTPGSLARTTSLPDRMFDGSWQHFLLVAVVFLGFKSNCTSCATIANVMGSMPGPATDRRMLFHFSHSFSMSPTFRAH